MSFFHIKPRKYTIVSLEWNDDDDEEEEEEEEEVESEEGKNNIECKSKTKMIQLTFFS